MILVKFASKPCVYRLIRRKFNVIPKFSFSSNVNKYVTINDEGDEDIGKYLKEVVNKDFDIAERFIDETKESSLMLEVDKAFRRTKYQFDHWDGAIQGFRETEKKNWNEENMKIIEKIKCFVFDENVDIIPTTHVLDLADNGHIKPHIDSVKFCGNKIGGLNLLSDAVMRFRMEDNTNKFIDVQLPRLSLYIMRDALRYNFTHEVLSADQSYFNGQHIAKGRRVSIIHRNEPT